MATAEHLNQSNCAFDDFEKLRDLVVRAEKDPEMRSLFNQNPAYYLGSLSSFPLEIGGKTYELGVLLDSCDKNARLAVTKTVVNQVNYGHTVKSEGEEPTPYGIPLPIANVFVIANAAVTVNVLANGEGIYFTTVNYTSAFNAWGATTHSISSLDGTSYTVASTDRYQHSNVFHHLDECGLSLARQYALIKMFILQKKPEAPSNTSGTVSCSYLDVDFEVSYECRGEGILLTDAFLSSPVQA